MNPIDSRIVKFVKTSGLFEPRVDSHMSSIDERMLNFVKEAGTIGRSLRQAAIALQQAEARHARAAKGTAEANKARARREARAGKTTKEPVKEEPKKESKEIVELRNKRDELKRVRDSAAPPVKAAPLETNRKALPYALGIGIPGAVATGYGGYKVMSDYKASQGGNAVAGGSDGSDGTWAKKNLGISTGSNIGDAAIAGTAGLAGIYALYRSLRKDEDNE
jgi:hypothetical protein